MKTYFLLACLVLIVQAKLNATSCDLGLFTDSKYAWYNASYGFVSGLYDSENYPVATGCTKCRSFALPIANLQRSFASIYGFQDKYLSANSFDSLSFSDRLSALFTGYLVLWDFSVNLDAFIQEDTNIILWNQLLATFDSKFVGTFRNNLIANLFPTF